MVPGSPKRPTRRKPLARTPPAAPNAVGEVEGGDRRAGQARVQAHDPGAHQREGHSQEHRGGQDEQGRQQQLQGANRRGGAEGRHEGAESQSGDPLEQWLEQQAQNADHRLGGGVPAEQVAPADRVPAREPGAQGEAAHEEGDDETLGIGGVPEDQLEVAAPDRLVYEPGEPGCGKREKESEAEEIHLGAGARARCAKNRMRRGDSRTRPPGCSFCGSTVRALRVGPYERGCRPCGQELTASNAFAPLCRNGYFRRTERTKARDSTEPRGELTPIDTAHGT